MKVKYVITLAVSLLFLGCGDTENSVEDLKFGSLSGDYQIGEDCVVTSKGAKFAVEDCYLEELVGSPIKVSGGGTLGEETISFSGGGEEYFEDACHRSTCNISLSGSFKKLEGRQTSGYFEAFAGKWEGTVETQRVCTQIEVIAPSDPYCYKNQENVGNPYLDDTWSSNDTEQVRADIFGSSILLGDDESIEVLIDDDFLIVDGERFLRK